MKIISAQQEMIDTARKRTKEVRKSKAIQKHRKKKKAELKADKELEIIPEDDDDEDETLDEVETDITEIRNRVFGLYHTNDYDETDDEK